MSKFYVPDFCDLSGGSSAVINSLVVRMNTSNGGYLEIVANGDSVEVRSGHRPLVIEPVVSNSIRIREKP